MDRKTFSIILGIAFIACFFLPLNAGGQITGLKMLQHAGDAPKPIYSYLWLAFPISGLMLLIGAMRNNYPGGRSIWAWLPLLALITFMFILPMVDGAKIGDVFKGFFKGWGIGMWLAFISALVGALYSPR